MRDTLRDNLGRLVLSLADVLTAVVPFLADWNDSHLFSRQWSPHARFHGVVSLGMTATLSTAALWRLWWPRRVPPRGGYLRGADPAGLLGTVLRRAARPGHRRGGSRARAAACVGCAAESAWRRRHGGDGRGGVVSGSSPAR
jgi:hypothetical protein